MALYPQQGGLYQPYMNRYDPMSFYPQQPQTQPMAQQGMQGSGLKGRPVTSVDEARSIIIDFDGSIFYFPDMTRKNIYTKRMNMDGTSSIDTYRLIENTPAAEGGEHNINFVSQDMFEKTVKNLTFQIEQLKGERNNGTTTTTNEQFTF